MSYNDLAETYAVVNSLRWEELWDDICLFGIEQPFRVSEIIGKCPSIKHLAPKSQAEILRAHIRSHRELKTPADHLVKVTPHTKGGGYYAWQLHDEWGKPRDLLEKLPLELES